MKQVQVWFQVWFQVWLGSDVQGLDIRVGVTVGHWERFRQLGQGEIISSPWLGSLLTGYSLSQQSIATWPWVAIRNVSLW